MPLPWSVFLPVSAPTGPGRRSTPPTPCLTQRIATGGGVGPYGQTYSATEKKDGGTLHSAWATWRRVDDPWRVLSCGSGAAETIATAQLAPLGPSDRAVR